MPYLDEEGLSYYKTKTDKQISKKQDIVFLDGSPDIRVKYVTREEYNELTESDKLLPILYLVRGASSAENETENMFSSSNGLSQESAFGISMSPNNDEGIMTLDELDAYHDSYSASSSFDVFYAI